jgi:hypothetical protein
MIRALTTDWTSVCEIIVRESFTQVLAESASIAQISRCCRRTRGLGLRNEAKNGANVEHWSSTVLLWSLCEAA